MRSHFKTQENSQELPKKQSRLLAALTTAQLTKAYYSLIHSSTPVDWSNLNEIEFSYLTP